MKMCTMVQLSQDFLHYLVCFTIGMVLYSDSYGTSMFYKQHRKVTKTKDDFMKKRTYPYVFGSKQQDLIFFEK